MTENENKMKIKKLVLMAIRGDTALRRRIMEALDISEPTFRRMINTNSDDLTKAAVLRVIREELNLRDDEILEEVKATAEDAEPNA